MAGQVLADNGASVAFCKAIAGPEASRSMPKQLGLGFRADARGSSALTGERVTQGKSGKSGGFSNQQRGAPSDRLKPGHGNVFLFQVREGTKWFSITMRLCRGLKVKS